MEHLHIHLYPRKSEDNFHKKVETHHEEVLGNLEDSERKNMIKVLGDK